MPLQEWQKTYIRTARVDKKEKSIWNSQNAFGPILCVHSSLLAYHYISRVLSFIKGTSKIYKVLTNIITKWGIENKTAIIKIDNISTQYKNKYAFNSM